MSSWFRLLVLALLIPAYGLAAAGVVLAVSGPAEHGPRLLVEGHGPHPALLAAVAAAQAKADAAAGVEAGPGLSKATGTDDSLLSLVFELGDTSDDMPELGWPRPLQVPAGGPHAAPAPQVEPPPPQAWQPTLLRPPSLRA